MPNPKTSPWPVANHLIEKRIEERHMAIHNDRIQAATAVVDSSEPEFMHHLDHDAKKAEKDRERQYEIDAENARLYQKLAAIEDFDSSQVIRSSTTRSSLTQVPGMFFSTVGGHQCVDHINMTATVNPHSAHYQGHVLSRTGSRAGSRQGSRHGSGNPSPIRGSEVSSSLHNAVWSGHLLRAPSPDARNATAGAAAAATATATGTAPAPHHTPRRPSQYGIGPEPSTGSTGSLPPLAPNASATAIPSLPPLPAAGPFSPPKPPLQSRSRYTSPARNVHSADEHPLITTRTSGESHVPTALTAAPGSALRASSPARIAPGMLHAPVPRAPSRSASPGRAIDSSHHHPPPHHPHPHAPSHLNPSHPPLPPHTHAQHHTDHHVEAGSGLLKVAARHVAEDSGNIIHVAAHGPRHSGSINGSVVTQSVHSVRSSSPSVARSNRGETIDLDPETMGWRDFHDARKADLAATYLAHGAHSKPRRESPYTSQVNSRVNSRSNSPMASRQSLSGVSALTTSGDVETVRSKSRAKVRPPGLPMPMNRYADSDLNDSGDIPAA